MDKYSLPCFRPVDRTVAITCMEIDTTRGFLYPIGLRGDTGVIFKVNLSDFSQVGRGSLSETELYVPVIDMTNNFLYIGCYLDDGKVLKVDLPSLSEIDSVSFESGENYITSAVIDVDNTFAYFGTATSPGQIVKVGLSPFARLGKITLNSDEVNLYSAVIDNTTKQTYFGTSYATGGPFVVKVNVSPPDFERIGAVDVLTGAGNLGVGIIDETNGFAYFADIGSALIYKINLSLFTLDDTLSLGPFVNGVIDVASEFAYFGSGDGQIFKINLDTFSEEDSLSTGYFFPLYGAAIDVTSGFAYFADTAGTILKVSLDTFSVVSTLTLS